MARPAKFDRAEAVKQVMQEIWRSGYEASSVKAISEKLGITRSSYYNAFGTREDLFKEALAVYAAEAPDNILSGDLAGVPVLDLIAQVFRNACAARAEDPEGRGCMVVNSLCELAGGPHVELGAMLADAVRARVARLELLLEAAISRGELPIGTDARATAMALQCLLIGINTMSKAVRDESELWQASATGLRALGIPAP